jgi:hypothetical protein
MEVGVANFAEFSPVWDKAQTQIGHLLRGLRREFTPSEIGEVQTFLQVREYGLALETLSSILVEEKKPINRAVVHEIDKVARLLDLAGETFMVRLHQFADGQGRAGPVAR